MKKAKYDLARALRYIFVELEVTEEKIKPYDELLEQTSMTYEEFHELAGHDQTLGQLKYRILGLMDKKKIDSTHII